MTEARARRAGYTLLRRSRAGSPDQWYWWDEHTSKILAPERRGYDSKKAALIALEEALELS